MTPPEWMAADNPAELLAAVGDRLSPRKARLWACASARHDWDGLVVEGDYGYRSAAIQLAVEAAERFCEGAADAAELAAAAAKAEQAYEAELRGTLTPDGVRRVAFKRWGAAAAAADILAAVREAAGLHATDLANAGELAAGLGCIPPALADIRAFMRAEIESSAAHARLVAGLLRGVIHDPVVTFSQSWRTPSAFALASAMYTSRDFSAMPVLADALEEAGCCNPMLLHHLRGEGPRVRGDWVVDLVLGKE